MFSFERQVFIFRLLSLLYVPPDNFSLENYVFEIIQWELFIKSKLTINEINFVDSTLTSSAGSWSSSGSMVLRGRGRIWCSKSRLLELRSNFPLMKVKKWRTRIRCKTFIVLKRLVLSVSGCRLKWDHQGPYKSHWCEGCMNHRVYFAQKN